MTSAQTSKMPGSSDRGIEVRSLETIEVIRSRDAPGVVRVRLNRPGARNAINDAMRRDLEETFDVLAVDDQLQAVIVCASGPYFCAGNDVTELAWLGDTTAGAAESAFREHNVWLDKLGEFPLPVFAVVQGGALGHAAELVARCDVVISGDDAVFGWPEVRAGGVPNSVWPLRLNHLGVVKECFLTGRLLTAYEAQSVGLINHIVTPARLDEFAESLVDDLSRLHPYALRSAKAAVNAASSGNDRDYLERTLLVNALAHDSSHASDFWENAKRLGPKEANRLLQPGGEPYWSRTW